MSKIREIREVFEENSQIVTLVEFSNPMIDFRVVNRANNTI